MLEPTKIRVAVNGYGVIGKRVAAAVMGQSSSALRRTQSDRREMLCVRALAVIGGASSRLPPGAAPVPARDGGL